MFRPSRIPGRIAVAIAPLAALCVLGACVDRVADKAEADRIATAFPDWAFPGAGVGSAPPPPDEILHVPGSDRTYSRTQIADMMHAPDWRPETHPAPPAIVLTGAGAPVFACGYCHLPDGAGRPENASLTGLPADYIVGQVLAMRSGDRAGAKPDWPPSHFMTGEASGVRDEDLRAAAAYFAVLKLPRQRTVREVARVRHPVAAHYLFRPGEGEGPMEPIGLRILEGPVDFGRFERRDPQGAFEVLVPTGSLARGKVLAAAGAGATPACGSCHGTDLKGGAVPGAPPLAGRSPSYLFRQLWAFRTGARHGGMAEVMRPVAAVMSRSDMIAAAAWDGSLEP